MLQTCTTFWVTKWKELLSGLRRNGKSCRPKEVAQLPEEPILVSSRHVLAFFQLFWWCFLEATSKRVEEFRIDLQVVSDSNAITRKNRQRSRTTIGTPTSGRKSPRLSLCLWVLSSKKLNDQTKSRCQNCQNPEEHLLWVHIPIKAASHSRNTNCRLDADKSLWVLSSNQLGLVRNMVAIILWLEMGLWNRQSHRQPHSSGEPNNSFHTSLY